MDNTEKLQHSHNHWVTTMGAWFPGKKVMFRNKDLHRDLKDMEWMELYLFSITGRTFSPEEMKVFHAMWMYTSFPDPRLWNNRVAALAGTTRSTATLALASGVAVSEASIYGHRPNTRTIDYFLRTKAKLDNGAQLIDCIKDEFKKYRTIFGFGRPLNRDDERNPHFLEVLAETGMIDGPHLKIALETEKLLLAGRWRMRANLTGLAGAVAADIGLSPREHHLFLTPCFIAGMPPCYLDTREKPEGTFFPVKCDDIHYQGVEKRSW